MNSLVSLNSGTAFRSTFVPPYVGGHFLLKPMDIDEIIGRVKECLATPINTETIAKSENAPDGDARFSTALLEPVHPE